MRLLCSLLICFKILRMHYITGLMEYIWMNWVNRIWEFNLRGRYVQNNINGSGSTAKADLATPHQRKKWFSGSIQIHTHTYILWLYTNYNVTQLSNQRHVDCWMSTCCGITCPSDTQVHGCFICYYPKKFYK